MFDNCKRCFMYNEDYDELGQQSHDEGVDGESIVPPHFCISFNNGIPQDIWRGKAKCPEYFNFEES